MGKNIRKNIYDYYKIILPIRLFTLNTQQQMNVACQNNFGSRESRKQRKEDI